MSRLYLSLVILSSFFFYETTNAQRACGTDTHYEMLLQEDPKFAEKRQQIENFTQQYIASGAADRNSSGVITIPVVFHVIYKTAGENVPDAWLMAQLEVLNEDFRRMNSDTSNTRAMFKDDAADLEIEFCLASVDPSGNPTTGITRTSTSVASFSTDDAVKFTAQGGQDAWPASDYLNFWVANLGSGLLGYAQFPGGPANRDGVVCLYSSLPGAGAGPYSDGRTATHEVGHWLNLYHTFQGGCSGSGDQVSDTPPLASPNYGCPSSSASCTGGEAQYENYMDYVNDACMNMFSNGQKTRVDALFTGGGARVSLLASNGCSAPTPPTCDDGIQNGDETGIDCGGPVCPECPPCLDMTLTINFDDYPEETSWKVLNSSGTIVMSSFGTYAGYPEGGTVTENFCLPYGCYDFVMEDSYGDGMCCSYGNGNYTLKDIDGNTIASGASFAATDITDFCLSEGEVETCEAPTNVSYGVTFRRAGKITWDEVENASYYIAEARKLPQRWKSYPVTTNWKAYGLRKFGQTYNFRVRTVCDNGLTSDYSDVFIYEVGTGKFGILGELTLYPNPAINQLQVNYILDEAADVTYRITDMLGQVVSAEQTFESAGQVQRYQDVSALPGGMYILEVEAAGDRQLYRFMVSK